VTAVLGPGERPPSLDSALKRMRKLCSKINSVRIPWVRARVLVPRKIYHWKQIDAIKGPRNKHRTQNHGRM
jgi:hypothetical protein